MGQSLTVPAVSGKCKNAWRWLISGHLSFTRNETIFPTGDIRSLIFHAERNHFSNWLIARTEFDLAARLRPRHVGEFNDPKDMRTFLVETLKDFRHERQVGSVTDFSRDQFDGHAEFLRIGKGSLGGKGRGLAFINNLVSRYPTHSAFPGTRISVPRSAVICTDAFDQFMESNNLTEFALGRGFKVISSYRRLPTGSEIFIAA